MTEKKYEPEMLKNSDSTKHEKLLAWYQTREKDPDWEVKYDTNNFYCYLPGGYKRIPTKNRELDLNANKLTSALDQLLDEIQIDREQLHGQILKGMETALEGKDLFQDDPEKAKKLIDEGEKMRNEGLKKLHPLFERMLALGFKERDLRG